MRVDVPEYNTFIDFPDNTPPAEIQMAMEKNFPSKSEPGLLSRIGKDLSERASEIENVLKPTSGETSSNILDSILTTIGNVPRRALRTTGAVAGGIGDLIAEPIKSAYQTFVPEAAQKNISQSLKSGIVRDSTGRVVGLDPNATPQPDKFIAGVSKTAQANPEATKDIMAAMNILSLLPGAKAAQKATTESIVPKNLTAFTDLKNVKAPIESKSNIISGLAEKYKIPTTLGEQTGNTILQKEETILERIPVLGIRKFREKQLEAADNAAKSFVAKYVADPGNPTFWGNKEFVDSLYSGVEDLAKKVNVTTRGENIYQSAKELLERYPSIFESIQDTRTKGIVKNLVSDTSGFAQPKGTPGNITFDDLWSLRKGLGGAKETARAQGNIEAAGILSKLKSAVDADIDKIGEMTGTNIGAKLKAANDAYKTYNVKYEMIQTAYDKAVGKVGAGEIFSPKKFSTELKNMVYKNNEVNKNALFSAKEVDEISGLANIMQVVKRAGQLAENPPNGNRAIDLFMTGGAGYMAFTHPYITGGAIGIAGIIKFLTTTEKGKRIAIAASKLDTYSNGMKSLMLELNRSLPRAASVTANKQAQEGMRK